jgi:hypothetical protein
MSRPGRRKKALSAGSQTDRIVLDSTPEPEGEEDTVIHRVNQEAILDSDPPVNVAKFWEYLLHFLGLTTFIKGTRIPAVVYSTWGP